MPVEGGECREMAGDSGLPALHKVCGFMAVAYFSGACLLGTQPKGQGTVLSILFTGSIRNPVLASQPEEDTASEDDQLPLQLLKSH